MKTREIIDIYTAIANLREPGGIELPASVGYALLRNFRKLEPIVLDFYEARRELVFRFGKPSDLDANNYVIENENDLAYVNGELDKLLNTDEDITLVKFNLSALDGINLPLSIMDLLYTMVDESGEE